MEKKLFYEVLVNLIGKGSDLGGNGKVVGRQIRLKTVEKLCLRDFEGFFTALEDSQTHLSHF